MGWNSFADVMRAWSVKLWKDAKAQDQRHPAFKILQKFEKIVIDEGFWQIPLSISAWLYRKMASPDRSDEEIDEGMDVDDAGEGDHFFVNFSH